MHVAIGNDHVALELKTIIKAHLEALGHEVTDYGAVTSERTDYPIYAEKVAHAVVEGAAACGILICGTGVGISIAANKVKGARCVVCSEPYSAQLSREHNDSNILAFGARVVGADLAKMIVTVWLNANYEAGRHANRLKMIEEIEKKQ